MFFLNGLILKRPKKLTLWLLTLAPVYLFLETLDLYPVEVELVALVPHSSQQLSNVVVLGVDHLLGEITAETINS